MQKRVYIAYTGGTIGMKKTAEGYVPVPGYLEELMAVIPELQHYSMPQWHVHQYDPLLDSANMTPDDWLKIAKDIAAHHDDYDGFVVLHGTDTMAYTSSALPFFLQGLQKPVVVTGSQIPLCEIRNDARENLITSLIIAANFSIPEVLLCFGSKLLRGNRAVKLNASGFEAFDSPNYPPIGSAGIKIDISWRFVLAPRRPPKKIQPMVLRKPVVASLRLFPGISAGFIKAVLQPPLQGLVLETYGIGNGPHNDHALMAALKDACSRGIVIVNCSQCIKGSVSPESYATGSALARAGLISGRDMTTEAALTKLYYLLSQDLPLEEVKKLMTTDLCGELTPST